MALVQVLGAWVCSSFGLPPPPLQHAQIGVDSVGSLGADGDDALALGPAVPGGGGWLPVPVSGSSAYGGVLFAQIRSLFPIDLAGRSATIT